MISLKNCIGEGHKLGPFQVNERELSSLALAELGVGLTPYWDFVAYPELSEDTIPFTGMFLDIKKSFISSTFASRYINTQSADVKKGICANGEMKIWFKFKGVLCRRQLTVYVVEESDIENIVRRKTVYLGNISGAKADPDMLLGINYGKKNKFIRSSLEHEATREERKAEAQSASQETGIPVGMAGQSGHLSILSLPNEILQSICRWIIAPVAGEVLVGRTAKGTLRFFEIKDFCTKCLNDNSCDLHPTWRSYFSHRLIVGPLVVGDLFLAHSRLSTLSREMFYQETKFHFCCDSDLSHFCTTLGKNNLMLVRQISLLNWKSLDIIQDHLLNLRTMDVWIKKSVLETSFEFHHQVKSFEVIISELHLRVILFEEESNVLESDDDEDNF